MNRVEAAIQEGRCVLAIGGRALPQPEVLAELRRRSLPVVALGGEVLSPAVPPSAEALAPALQNEGGVLVLVEPDPGVDGRALGEIERLVKQGRHKPRLVVVARSFNPFGLPMAMRLLKLEQEKQRAQDFLALLPAAAPVAVAPAAQAAPTTAAPAAAAREAEPDRIPVPRPDLVGREEERAALKEMLESDGGPIVVTGPEGVGRRWLVEATLAEAGLQAFPELIFEKGVGADTFFARLAIMARVSGDDRLHDALTGRERPQPADLARLVADVLSGDAFAGKAWVLYRFENLLDRRDGGFWRDGRLEMALAGVLTGTPKLRLIIVTGLEPRFYREGQARNLRVLKVAGLKGRELHELYASYHVPEFPRDRFGPINDRTHGHPMINRQLAIAIRESGDVEDILEQPKFLRAESVEDLTALRRNLHNRVEKLEASQRRTLAAVAHLRYPGRAEDLQVLGINRNTRLRMLADGLLEQTPHKGDDRRYYVHPLVTAHLNDRETADFDTMEILGMHYLARAKDLKREDRLVESIAMAQEGNRLLVEGRKGRERLRLPYPDHDPVMESVRELMRRRKNPRLDIARMRLNEARKEDPQSPELLILDAELKALEKNDPDAVQAAFDEAAQAAPVPEVFHAEANFYMSRKSRGRAMQALEKGIVAFPDDGRLHRRLGGLYMLQGKMEDAEKVLRRAQELEPMMPDTYGMLGEIQAGLGVNHWDDAQASLDEALRLSPEDPQHLGRAADLLRRRSMVATEAEVRAAFLSQAEELLRRAIQVDSESWRVQNLLATVILDQGGDLEQAEWLLKKSLKKQETVEAYVERARVAIRQQSWTEAEQLIERAIKKDGSYHPAFAVRGELEEARGQIFLAFEAYKTARERSPRSAPERARYERRMQDLGALIEAGAASELMRQAEATGGAEQAPTGEDGPRRDAGTTTILRKREREGAAQAPAEPQGAESTEGGEPGVAPVEQAEDLEREASPELAGPTDEALVEVAPTDASPEPAGEIGDSGEPGAEEATEDEPTDGGQGTEEVEPSP